MSELSQRLRALGLSILILMANVIGILILIYQKDINYLWNPYYHLIGDTEKT